MRVLGVHDGINASACLLEDGVLRYAIQEERLTGVKEYAGMPRRSIKRIYDLAGIGGVDEVALATDYAPRRGPEPPAAAPSRHLLRDLSPALFAFWEDNAPVVKARLPRLAGLMSNRRNAARVADLRASANGHDGPVTIVEHHLAHGASALFSAPFREPALVITKDAEGDALCSTVAVGDARTGAMTRVSSTLHTHSYGYLYSYVTGHLGMRPHRDEYKVMGLAPHGSPAHGQRAYDTFRGYVGLSSDGLAWERKVPEPMHSIMPRLIRDLHGQRFDDIAWGLQTHLESLMVEHVRAAVRRTGVRRVAAAGGVFMNVKANKLIREMPEVEAFFPMPSAGDESTSIGAAYAVYAQRMKEQGSEPNIRPLGPLYLGDDFTNEDVERSIRHGPWAEADEMPPFDVERSDDIDATVAGLVLDGHIVARCKGPMEFGARALGNRSILCDARRLENVGIINRVIKSRDFWMPFAPVVTATEDFPDHYFATREAAPYMTMAFGTTQMARRDLRAALHQADFTARPQILEPSWNPGYHSILEWFLGETGVGGLLNTSFNLHGKPIVHGPREALDTFLSSGLEYLALGDYLVYKKC